MKTKIISLLLIFVACTFSFADDLAKAKTSKKEIRESLLENVDKTAKNGDITIKIPDSAPKGLESRYLSPYLAILLTYVDPDMDFEKFSEKMNKGASNKIASIMAVSKAYLASKNIKLKMISFSANNVRMKLDEGLPLFAYVSADNPSYEKIALRTKDRPEEAEKMAEWTKILKKNEVKSFKKGRIWSDTMISGYNKQTGEYLMWYGAEPIWLSEAELKKALNELYQVSF